MERCEECGFEYDLSKVPLTGSSIVEGAVEFAEALGSGVAELAVRREPTVWSPLEYACHLRDVLLVQRERVLLVRRSTGVPSLEPMGREERAAHDGYADQRPADVARQLVDAARMFAHVLDRLSATDWESAVLYNYPVRTERTLRWVATHTLHEVRHHLLDIRRQLGGT